MREYGLREYGFSLTRILPYKDGIYDSVFIQKNLGRLKPVFSYILCSDLLVRVLNALELP